MVWDPPKQEVNVKRIIIYSFIPILNLYAGWRIQKFWVLAAINFGVGIITNVIEGVFIPFESDLILLSYAGVIGLSVYVVRHFAKKYNEKIRMS